MAHTLAVFETSHQSRILAEISEIQCPRSSLLSSDVRLCFWNFGRLKSRFNSWKVVALPIERVNLKGNGGEMITKLKLECESYILVVSLDLKALAEHSLYPVSFFFFDCMACGILVLQPEIEPTPLGVLTTGQPGKSHPMLSWIRESQITEFMGNCLLWSWSVSEAFLVGFKVRSLPRLGGQFVNLKFFSVSQLSFLWYNKYKMNFITLATFKCTVQGYHPHCCATITTIHLQSFHLPKLKFHIH